MKTLLVVISIVTLLVSACQLKPLGRESKNGTEITLTVLTHSITNVGNNLEVVQFVDLAPEQIRNLTELCEGKYEIYPLELSVTDKKDVPGEIPISFLHLKNSKKEGVIHSVESIKSRGKKAEVDVSYQTSGSVSMDRYFLKFSQGKWSISSVRNIYVACGG